MPDGGSSNPALQRGKLPAQGEDTDRFLFLALLGRRPCYVHQLLRACILRKGPNLDPTLFVETDPGRRQQGALAAAVGG